MSTQSHNQEPQPSHSQEADEYVTAEDSGLKLVERVAAALERIAEAMERSADAAETQAEQGEAMSSMAGIAAKLAGGPPRPGVR